MNSRHIFAAALLAVVAAEPARAQFTATVAPPKREKPAAQVAAETQAAAQADTTRRTQLSEMRAWVDSAAQAATGRPVVAQDSTVVTATETTTTTAAAGSVALPATASPLPVIALGGGLLLLVGALLFGRPERARARSRRDPGR